MNLISIFATEENPVPTDVFSCIINFLKSCKTNELSQSPFGRANLDKITPTNLNLKVTSYPGCYDVILGPYPTIKFIVPSSDSLNLFLVKYNALTEGDEQ